MKVLFAVNDEKDAEAITRVYQKEYKEIISSKTVYYFNAIIKELQKDKTYDRIVISEDLEMFSTDNYQAVDKFIFDKMDAISDEATNTEGNDIPIILLCMDRRTKNDPLLVRFFGLGLYNVLVGQDRSVQKVASLMYKPRTKKEAKVYYKVESENVTYSASGKNDEVSETEIQNILNHYKKIGNNVSKCVQSFDSIASQYSKEQVKLIITVLPKNVKTILEQNSDSYRKIMGIKGSKKAQTDSKQDVNYVEKEIESGKKLTQPVIIPTAVSSKKVNKVLSAEEMKKKKIEKEEKMAKEKERLAKEREEARRIEKERLAKEREEARKREKERIAKEKEAAKKKEEERLAKEREEAKKKEEERLAKEREEAKKKENETPVVAKRGRGRPRKNIVEETTVEDVPIKRKRGRPRKTEVNNEETNKAEAFVEKNDEDLILEKKSDTKKSVLVNKDLAENNKPNKKRLFDDEEDDDGFFDFDEFDNFDEVDNSKEDEKIDEDLYNFDDDGLEDEDSFNFDDEDELEDEDEYNFDDEEESEDEDEYNFDDEEESEDEDEYNFDDEDESEDEDEYNFDDEEESEDEDEYNFDDEEESEDEDEYNFDDEDELEDEDSFDFDEDELEDEDNFDNEKESEDEDEYNFEDEDELDDEDSFSFDDEEESVDEDSYDFDDEEDSEEEKLEDEDEDSFEFDEEDLDEDSYTQEFKEDDNTVDDEEELESDEEFFDIDDETEEESEQDEEDSDKELEEDEENSNTHNGTFKGITNRNYRYDNNLANSIKNLKEVEDNMSYNIETDKLITSGQKLVSFVGTSKNGTSFIVNNLAEIFANRGIKTAILDLTKNKNSYYVYTNNEDELRELSQSCLDKLRDGTNDGIVVNKNLTVFTSLPGQDSALDDVTNIIKTLLENYEMVLLDCDFDTDVRYFRAAQEIYLVQTLDVLTIQPLTAFLRDLKNKNILDTNKLRIVINKNVRVNSLNDRILIGGMSVYNDPAMTYMTELFNKDTIKYITIPFEEQVYIRYLEGLVNCRITVNGYSKGFVSHLNKLADMVYPRINGKKNKKQYNDYSGQNKNFENTFSTNTSSVLNKMKKKY